MDSGNNSGCKTKRRCTMTEDETKRIYCKYGPFSIDMNCAMKKGKLIKKRGVFVMNFVEKDSCIIFGDGTGSLYFISNDAACEMINFDFDKNWGQVLKYIHSTAKLKEKFVFSGFPKEGINIISNLIKKYGDEIRGMLKNLKMRPVRKELIKEVCRETVRKMKKELLLMNQQSTTPGTDRTSQLETPPPPIVNQNKPAINNIQQTASSTCTSTVYYYENLPESLLGLSETTPIVTQNEHPIDQQASFTTSTPTYENLPESLLDLLKTTPIAVNQNEHPTDQQTASFSTPTYQNPPQTPSMSFLQNPKTPFVEEVCLTTMECENYDDETNEHPIDNDQQTASCSTPTYQNFPQTPSMSFLQNPKTPSAEEVCLTTMECENYDDETTEAVSNIIALAMKQSTA